MIYELYITNKMKIIILSWDNSFKSKQFIGTNWWASLASTLSSIGAILKQELKKINIIFYNKWNVNLQIK